MKKIKLLVMTATFSVLTGISALAGTWVEDGTGWWYDNGDSTYAKDGWSWIDGKCYYFTAEGYCLIDTTTPDGYEVDKSGAWITEETEEAAETTETAKKEEDEAAAKTNTFQFKKPEGYSINSKIEKGDMYMKSGSAIWVYEANYQNEVGNIEEIPLDTAMTNNYGVYSKKTAVQFNGSEWTRYDYTGGSSVKILYSRVADGNWHVIYFQGHLADVNTDEIMAACLQ